MKKIWYTVFEYGSKWELARCEELNRGHEVINLSVKTIMASGTVETYVLQNTDMVVGVNTLLLDERRVLKTLCCETPQQALKAFENKIQSNLQRDYDWAEKEIKEHRKIANGYKSKQRRLMRDAESCRIIMNKVVELLDKGNDNVCSLPS